MKRIAIEEHFRRVGSESVENRIKDMDEAGIAKKCNLCIDKDVPLCVLTCPTEALKMDSEDVLTQKRDKIAEELRRVKMIMKY